MLQRRSSVARGIALNVKNAQPSVPAGVAEAHGVIKVLRGSLVVAVAQSYKAQLRGRRAKAQIGRPRVQPPGRLGPRVNAQVRRAHEQPVGEIDESAVLVSGGGVLEVQEFSLKLVLGCKCVHG